MLTALLPGFRDFRTPLVTGGLYLFGLWILFAGADRLPTTSSSNDAMQQVAKLADLVGPTATLAAVGLGAYLMGSLAVISTDNLLIGFFQAWRSSNEGGRTLEIERFLMSPITPYEYYRASDQFHTTPWSLAFARKAEERFNQHIRTSAYNIEYANDQLIDLMHIQRPALYDDFDRLRSEAELRLSLGPPLFLACIALAIKGNWWWLVALLVPIVLFRQGLKIDEKAQNLVIRALIHGTVELPLVDQERKALKEHIDNSPQSLMDDNDVFAVTPWEYIHAGLFDDRRNGTILEVDGNARTFEEWSKNEWREKYGAASVDRPPGG